MESWEILEIVIPRNASKKVAQYLSISADYVRRWRREPDSDDSPSASGQRSILDRICDLIDVCFLVNPKDTYLIIRHIKAHYNNLVQTHSIPFNSRECQALISAEVLQEAVEAVNHLNLNDCNETTYKELVQLRTKADEAIARVEKTFAIRSNQNV